MKVRLKLRYFLNLQTVFAPHLAPVLLRKTSIIPKGIAFRLRKICDDDVTFDKKSFEYQSHLNDREHKLSTGKQQFYQFRNKTRAEARRKQEKQDKVSDVKFIIIQHCLTSTK